MGRALLNEKQSINLWAQGVSSVTKFFYRTMLCKFLLSTLLFTFHAWHIHGSCSAGQYSLNVWISNVNNGAVDSDTTNNQITKTVNVVNEIFPKAVVYEEGTGTWCGWCVRGHVGLKDMYHNHPDGSFIGIAVHNADPMVLTEYDSEWQVL